jgi:hypothetical protein
MALHISRHCAATACVGDVENDKAAAQVLRRLVAELCGAQNLPQAQMRRFLKERCAGSVCVAGLRCGGLDARDAAVSALLTELAGLLLDCAGRCDGELPAHLRMHVLPQLSLPASLQARRHSLLISAVPSPGCINIRHQTIIFYTIVLQCMYTAS